MIESWHSALESGLLAGGPFTTKAQAMAAVPEWIDHYNRHRRHSVLSMMPPIAYEQALTAGEAA